jgi:hypothetical protein
VNVRFGSRLIVWRRKGKEKEKETKGFGKEERVQTHKRKDRERERNKGIRKGRKSANTQKKRWENKIK